MPTFFIHEHAIYEVEATDADEALELFLGHGVAMFPCAIPERYVLDENGDSCAYEEC